MLEKVVKILGWVVLGAAAVISVLFFLLPGEAPEMQAAMDALDGATGAEKIEGVDAAAKTRHIRRLKKKKMYKE